MNNKPSKVFTMRPIKDYTIEDAIREHKNGFAVVCGDGKVKYITNVDED